ncbi:MAG: ABC transporter substrate-binding protein [Proteobacteria bacterium]|nr:ABC transporter substrate-binding protein [Pseudomonadota bacterium]MBU1738345.1 ABC transporter substrate-binding protein [Pseudomonadota bacterium]
MKRATILILMILATVFSTGQGAAEELTKIRIGWQIPWATQGQLVQILKHTDILKKNGLEAEFIGRTYGPVLNELALADEIDVVLTADQPAAALFSKDQGWIGVGRLMYNRTLTYVPPKSAVNSLEDLREKTIGIPIGAAAERVTIAALKKAGLEPNKDVKIINLGIREQGPLVLGGEEAKTWGNIDALSGFDPTPAIFEARGLIKVLDIGKVCSLVLMNENFITRNSGVAEKMMQALFDAYDYYRQNIEQANTWFMDEAGLKDSSQKACNVAASIEPNVSVPARKDIRVTLIDEDFEIMHQAAEFMAPKIKKNVDMRQYVSNKYAAKAH